MPHRVIGNGSLINARSLARTCPGASIIQPCLVRGWRRHLQLAAANRVDPDSGIAPCVINSARGSEDDWFNGVVISVPDNEFDALRARECLYDLVDVTPLDCASDRSPLDRAGLWVSSHPMVAVPWQLAAQRAYLDICIGGCRDFGSVFLGDFLTSTYVDDLPLGQHPSFLALGLVSADEAARCV